MRAITCDGKEMEFDGKEWKEVGQYNFKKEDAKIKVKVKKEGNVFEIRGELKRDKYCKGIEESIVTGTSMTIHIIKEIMENNSDLVKSVNFERVLGSDVKAVTIEAKDDCVDRVQRIIAGAIKPTEDTSKLTDIFVFEKEGF